MNEKLILEIKRNLMLMDVNYNFWIENKINNKNLLLESSILSELTPFIKGIFKKAPQYIEKEADKLLVNGIKMSKRAYGQIIKALDNPDTLFTVLKGEAKNVFLQVLSQSEELASKVYKTAIQDFLQKNPNATEKKLMELIQKKLQIVDPVLNRKKTLKELLDEIFDGDELAVELMESRISKNLENLKTNDFVETVFKTVDDAVESGIKQIPKFLWSAWKNIEASVIKFYRISGANFLKNQEKIDQKILGKAKAIQSMIDKGEQNIDSQLEELFILISTRKKWKDETKGLEKRLNSYILENVNIPKENLDNLLKNPYVQEVLATLNETVKESTWKVAVDNFNKTISIYPFLRWFSVDWSAPGLKEAKLEYQNMVKKFGINSEEATKALSKVKELKESFGTKDYVKSFFKGLTPDLKRLKQTIIWKDARTFDEAMSQTIRHGQYSASLGQVMGWVFITNVLHPTILTFLQSIYTNQNEINKFNTQIRAIKLLCDQKKLNDDVCSEIQEIPNLTKSAVLEMFWENMPVSHLFDWTENHKSAMRHDYNGNAAYIPEHNVISWFTYLDEFVNTVLLECGWWAEAYSEKGPISSIKDCYGEKLTNFGRKTDEYLNKLKEIGYDINTTDPDAELKKLLEKYGTGQSVDPNRITTTTTTSQQVIAKNGWTDDAKNYLISNGINKDKMNEITTDNVFIDKKDFNNIKTVTIKLASGSGEMLIFSEGSGWYWALKDSLTWAKSPSEIDTSIKNPFY